jgi:hypothetical protein
VRLDGEVLPPNVEAPKGWAVIHKVSPSHRPAAHISQATIHGVTRTSSFGDSEGVVGSNFRQDGAFNFEEIMSSASNTRTPLWLDLLMIAGLAACL